MERDNGYRTFDKTEIPDTNNVHFASEEDAVRSLTKGAATYTVDEAIEKIGFGRFQITLSLVAGIAWIADSMELMALSLLGPVLLCQWQLTTTKEAFITTVVFIGFAIGSPVVGWLADRYGRKTALIFTASWAAFFGILSSFSPFYTWLLILRCLTGLGLAGVPQAVTYYSEFLPSKYRGKCIIMLEFSWAFGAVFEVLLAMLLLSRFGWGPWLMASSVPLLIFIPCCLALPESPRYLMTCGRTKEAQKVLIHVAKVNGSMLPPGELGIEPETPRAQIKDLFTPEYRLSTLILWMIWFVATFSYYGIVLLSTELIEAGTSCVQDGGLPLVTENVSCVVGCQSMSQNDYYQLIWTSAAELPGLALTALYIDYIGRKTALMINLTIYSTAIFLLLICVNQLYTITLLFVGRALISSGLQIGYIYTPELYPTVVRAIGIGTANIFARIGAIITPFVSQVLIHKSLVGTLCTYGCLGILAAVLTFLLPIETKGRDMKVTAHEREDKRK